MTANSAAGVSVRCSSAVRGRRHHVERRLRSRVCRGHRLRGLLQAVAQIGFDAGQVVQRVTGALREVGVVGDRVARHRCGLFLPGSDDVGGVGQLVGSGRGRLGVSGAEQRVGPRQHVADVADQIGQRHETQYQPSSEAMSSFKAPVSVSAVGSPASTATTSSTGRPAAFAVSAADRLARRRAA